MTGFVGKGQIKKGDGEKREKKKERERKRKRRRERGSGLFWYEISNIYPLWVLNFQLRVRVILVVFSIFDNYETSSSFQIRILS